MKEQIKALEKKLGLKIFKGEGDKVGAKPSRKLTAKEVDEFKVFVNGNRTKIIAYLEDNNMTHLNQTALTIYLDFKKERVEKLSNFADIALEKGVELEAPSDFKALMKLSDEARKEAYDMSKEIEFVEKVDWTTCDDDEELDIFSRLMYSVVSDEDIVKAEKIIVDFCEQVGVL